MGNLDLPNLIKSAVPEAENRNVRILDQNSTSGGYRDANFLSSDFPKTPPKLYITSEEDDFDAQIVEDWKEEGFDVEYFSMEACMTRGQGEDGAERVKQYVKKLKELSAQKMDPCAKFGIIAFGEAAGICLEHYHVLDNNPEFKVGLLIAYYPTSIPDPKGRFPNAINTLVHLPVGEEIGVTKRSQMVGIQGKRRATRSKVERGAGVGGMLGGVAYRCYTYEAESGFAEGDMEEYDRVRSELAFSRSLNAARKTFGERGDVEAVVESNTHAKFYSKDHKIDTSTYTTNPTPHITHIPTLTGASTASSIADFYAHHFTTPPSLKLTLLSRTTSPDRVIDEMHIRFKHTVPTPWILPGVAPTHKKVEVIMVSIVAVKGGKIRSEHLYWDQASVLVQVGLLNPKLVPEGMVDVCERLPVVGRKAARRVVKGGRKGEADNELIRGRESDEEEEEEDGEGGRGRDTEGKTATGQGEEGVGA